MKLSCLPVSLFNDILSDRLDIVAWAEAAENMGFDGFDISSMFLKNHTPTYLSSLKAGIASAGIPLIMVSSYPDFTHPDVRQRRREDTYLACDIAVTEELQGRYLRVLAGQAHPNVPLVTGVEQAVAGLRRAAEIAYTRDVTLVYENHAKPAAWHHIDFSFPPEVFLQVFEGIKDTGIMVNFDMGNSTAEAAREGDELRLLERVYDKVATFHVCDMKERGVFSPTLVGTGMTPLPELFGYIKGRGFDGWLCIEEASGTGMDGVRKAHDYVRDLWEKTTP